MSYPNILVKLISQRIQLVKRLSQAEGKFKFAIRHNQRKMCHSALGSTLSLNAKLNKLRSDLDWYKFLAKEIPISDNKVEPVSNKIQSIDNDCQVAVFDFYHKQVPNNKPRIKPIIEVATELTKLQFKALQHSGCYQRYWDTQAVTTVTALCCNNPSYFEPEAKPIVQAQPLASELEFSVHCGQLIKVESKPSTKHLANDAWLQSMMAIPVVATALDATAGYYKLYFTKEKVCLGGVTRHDSGWAYSGDYYASEMVWLPSARSYNPQSKHLGELLAISRPPMKATTAEKRKEYKLEGEKLIMSGQQYKDNSGDYVSKHLPYWNSKGEVMIAPEWDLTKKQEQKDLERRGVYLPSLMRDGHWTPNNAWDLNKEGNPLIIYGLSCQLSNRKRTGKGRPHKPKQDAPTCLGNSITKYWGDRSRPAGVWDLTKKRELKALQSLSNIDLEQVYQVGYWQPDLAWDKDNNGNPLSLYVLSCQLDNRKNIGKSKMNINPLSDESVEKITSKTIPKTHQVWEGAVTSVNMVEGQNFNRYPDKYKSIGSSTYLKCLKIEIKTSTGETIQFWTPSIEYRVVCPPGCPVAITTVDESDWIKAQPAPKQNDKQSGDVPVPAVGLGDLISVSGKVKSTFCNTTIINWVRLQELIPHGGLSVFKGIEYQDNPGDTVIYLTANRMISTHYLTVGSDREFLENTLSIEELLKVGYTEMQPAYRFLDGKIIESKGYALACYLGNRREKVIAPILKKSTKTITSYAGEQLSLITV